MEKELSVFKIGQTNDAYAKFFTGQSYLNMLSLEQVVVGNVTFEPGCRNFCHIHHAKSGGGQILLCTAGRGYYQEWGKEAVELNPGTSIAKCWNQLSFAAPCQCFYRSKLFKHVIFRTSCSR